jgi:hypothetical protein
MLLTSGCRLIFLLNAGEICYRNSSHSMFGFRSSGGRHSASPEAECSHIRPFVRSGDYEAEECFRIYHLISLKDSSFTVCPSQCYIVQSKIEAEVQATVATIYHGSLTMLWSILSNSLPPSFATHGIPIRMNRFVNSRERMLF